MNVAVFYEAASLGLAIAQKALIELLGKFGCGALVCSDFDKELRLILEAPHVHVGGEVREAERVLGEVGDGAG